MDSMLKDIATIILSTFLLIGWVAFIITYPLSMHQQQQLQHQQFQKELEKIQRLQQQQLPFHAPGDVAQDAELLDSSGLYSESSGASSPSTSPRASNHSLHSSSSASRAGTSPFPEQDDEGKASCP